MKKLVLVWMLLCAPLLFSQNTVIQNGRSSKTTTSTKPKKKPQIDRWKIGGGVGMNFGNNDYLSLSVAPFVAYELVNNLDFGIATGYQYTKRRSSKQHLFNIGPFVDYSPIPQAFARVQHEYFSGAYKLNNAEHSTHFDENALWVGAGYRSPGPVQVYVGLMYNVLYNSDSRIFANGFRPFAGVSVRL